MALQFVGAGAGALTVRGLPTLASRAVSTANRMFKGSSKPPPVSKIPTAPSGDSSLVARGAKAVGGHVASTAATVGTFVAADALLSVEDLADDVVLEGELVRSAVENLPDITSESTDLVQAAHQGSPVNTQVEDPVVKAPTPGRPVMEDEPLPEIDAWVDIEQVEAIAETPTSEQYFVEDEPSSEMIAYASEIVMQKMDSKPLLDQVAFLTRRYRLTRSEAFEIAAGVDVYRFHPRVIELVAAVSSFNSTGTLLLGAQRATRGV